MYTTDVAYSKGVIPIKNKDFKAVISATNDSKGFKRGKQCESIKIGYDKSTLEKEIRSKIEKFSQIIIFGHGGYTLEQRTYFTKLKTQIPKDILIIALSRNLEGENVINVNACFDPLTILSLTELVRTFSEKPITLIFPECDRHTMSQMIFLKEFNNIKILVGRCTPILLNPNLINVLEKEFGIKAQTSAKKDLEYIIDKK